MQSPSTACLGCADGKAAPIVGMGPARLSTIGAWIDGVGESLDRLNAALLKLARGYRRGATATTRRELISIIQNFLFLSTLMGGLGSVAWVWAPGLLLMVTLSMLPSALPPANGPPRASSWGTPARATAGADRTSQRAARRRARVRACSPLS